jgi:hypothetical protein
MRIYVELKREAVPQVALNKIFKLTPLQTTFGYNAVALVDGVPKTLSLLELIRHYLEYQREVVTRRSKYELRQAEKRAHVLEGYLKALDSLDAVIALIRGAADTDDARSGLMRDFALSEIQAQAIRPAPLPADEARAGRDPGRVQRPAGANQGSSARFWRSSTHRRRDQGRAARAQGDLRQDQATAARRSCRPKTSSSWRI